MTKTNIIFNTDDYKGENDEMFMTDDMSYLIDEYVRKSNGTVKGFAVLAKRSSHYGVIGGNGAVGYNHSHSKDLVNAILTLTHNSDKIVGLINDNGELQVNYYDHDGVHETTWARITKSTEERFDNLVNYSEHEEIVEFIDNLPSVKIKAKYNKAA